MCRTTTILPTHPVHECDGQLTYLHATGQCFPIATMCRTCGKLKHLNFVPEEYK